MAQKYINIPVKPEVYAGAKTIAKANNRGLGDQVSAWVERDLPFCDHAKQAVTIEIYPAAGQASVSRKGWYCPTCNRVYQQAVEVPELAIKKQAQKETVK
jgi:hypothetical protein